MTICDTFIISPAIYIIILVVLNAISIFQLWRYKSKINRLRNLNQQGNHGK